MHFLFSVWFHNGQCYINISTLNTCNRANKQRRDDRVHRCLENLKYLLSGSLKKMFADTDVEENILIEERTNEERIIYTWYQENNLLREK